MYNKRRVNKVLVFVNTSCLFTMYNHLKNNCPVKPQGFATHSRRYLPTSNVGLL